MKIKKEIFCEMIQHCKSCFPYEACGILAGNGLVTEIYKIKNIEASSLSYFMEPKEQLKAMKDMKNKGVEMIAIFHSHPCSFAYPSTKDIELSFYDVYHVIIALNPDGENLIFEAKCFKIKDGKVYEEELVIEQ